MEITEIRAVVRSLEGNQAVVEVERGGCGRCHEKGGCGGQSLTQMLCTTNKVYRVANPDGARVGDLVTVGIPAAALRYSANLVYGLPLVGLFAGAGLGMAFYSDTGAALGGLAGLLAAWFLIRIQARAGLVNSGLQPKIIASGSSIQLEKED